MLFIEILHLKGLKDKYVLTSILNLVLIIQQHSTSLLILEILNLYQVLESYGHFLLA